MQPLSRSHRQAQLPLPRDAVGICIPCGIGDAAWIYSKLKHLPARLGREVWLSMPDTVPNRGHQLVELLPGIRWAGYETGWKNADVFQRSLPGDAGPEAFSPGVWHPLQVNTWLERGRRLAGWLPWLPIDYHFEIPILSEQQAEGAELTASLPGPRWAVYRSNRDREQHPGWALWTSAQWSEVLDTLPGSFVMLGAEYDRETTSEVADRLEAQGRTVSRCIGRPLGTALAAMRQCHSFLAYPSGIGIVANVLRVPGVMLLPRHLAGLARAYADPADLASGAYRAWVEPAPGEVAEWLKREGRSGK